MYKGGDPRRLVCIGKMLGPKPQLYTVYGPQTASPAAVCGRRGPAGSLTALHFDTALFGSILNAKKEIMKEG
jgi:hypothetical protein